jgi:NADPH:quinone reductase
VHAQQSCTEECIVKAAVLERFGGPDALDVREVPAPVPGPGEALIRVHAAGVNFGDTIVRAGGAPIAIDFPFIPGSEVTGVVEQLGPGVRTVAVGDHVIAQLFLAGRLNGGYAQFATLNADLLVPVPDGVGFEQAAALSMQGLTAWMLLRQTPIQGKTVLVHAAAGGVGSLLVQLAKLRGASVVVATAGSEHKVSLLRRLGAEIAINYRDEHWPEQIKERLNGRGPEVILDSVGGDIRRRSLELLAPFGALVVYGGSVGGGYASDGFEPAQVASLIVKNQSFSGFSVWPLVSDRASIKALLAECYSELFPLLSSGRLQVISNARYPLAEVREAHRAIEARETVGKVTLAP